MTYHQPVRRGLATTFRAAFAAFVCCCFFASAFAQTTTTKQTIDIPAGDAKQALKHFAAQTNEQLLAADTATAGVKTNAVKGEMTSAEALDALLAGTGLKADYDAKTRSFAVRKESDAESKNVNRAIAENSDRPNEKTEVSRNADGKVVLDTFEVFGKKSLNMDIRRSADDPQPYVVYDRRAIELSGVTNLQGFLQKNLTALQAQPDINTSPTAVAVDNFFNLRGFGADETLILLDGRRMARSTSANNIGQSDLSSIPLSAVERIEVLPTTASGIYGGSATAGVINIILRRDYAGVDFALIYGNAFDTDAAMLRAEFSTGLTLENGRTTILVSGSVSDGTDLLAQDRDFRGRFFDYNTANLAPGDPSSIYRTGVILGATTNVRSTTGANLTLKAAYGGGLLGSPVTSIAYGYAGPASDNGAGLIARAGKLNLNFAPAAGSGGTILYQAPQQSNIMASFRREMTSRLSIFVEASTSLRRDTRNTAASAAGFTVPGNAIGNPFNEQIVVFTPLSGFVGQQSARSETSRVGGGFIFKLPADWKLEADYTYDNSTFTSKQSAPFLSTNFSNAIAGGTINPFRDAPVLVDYSPYVPLTDGQNIGPTSAVNSTATLRGSGPLGFSRFTQGIILSGLVEYRDESISETRSFVTTNTGTVTRTVYLPREQQVTSAYLEARWPLIDASRGIPMVASLELQMAGRYDSYDMHTSIPVSVAADANWNPLVASTAASKRIHSSNPTIAFSYKPTVDLMIRGSHATGYLPPTVFQLVPNTGIPITGQLATLKDPFRGNESVTQARITNTQGSPGLVPESSTSDSAGLVFSPKQLKGLHLSVDWTKISKVDAFATSLNLNDQAKFEQFLLAFPDRITRGAPSLGFAVGPITGVDYGLVNYSQLEVEAVDYALDYSCKLGNNAFQFTAKATNNLHLVSRVTPSSAPTDDVGVIVSNGPLPDWRGNGVLSWERGPWTLAWSTQYMSSVYRNSSRTLVAAVGAARVPTQIYHDIMGRFRFGASGPKLLKNTDISIGVNNLFGKRPPMQEFAPYVIYAGGGDPRLSNYVVTIRKAL